MKRDRKKAYRRGQLAEIFAAALLIIKGFRILARRFKCRSGEIDLIAKRGSLVIFVEVKARADLTQAAFAITSRQKQRIIQASQEWLVQNPKAQNADMRFDAFLIAHTGRFRHIKAAFEAEY